MSTDSKTPQPRAIYEHALQFNDDTLRREYLDDVCGLDVSLRERVERLLQARPDNRKHLLQQVVSINSESPESCASAFEGTSLSSPKASGTDAAARKAIDVSQHPMIGPYRLLEELGRGGMGTVYVAQQTQPVNRRVALKLIREGQGSSDAVGRFEAERQALAMMDHPNIARVLDGGTTESGQPYFAMELVRGLPITEYCDERRLSTRQRLELFVDVCRAVHHAHQRGIIHRDIKPSNVMVGEIDEQPVAKVIDFGVAKALNQKLTEQTVYTRFAQMIGTPLYMSPEQAGLNLLDIDTRSDVYSLGVLLYELLTGTTPFDKDTLSSAGFDEMRRIIREDEPKRPSALVATLNAEAVSTVSERRRVDPRKFASTLRGEVDWIVMKALEKDRKRRFESASSLADDIKRHLAGEVVEACPPAKAYRLKKFAKRNRVALTTATLLTCSMLVGTGLSVWQASRAQAAEQLATDQKLKADRNLQVAIDALQQMLANVGNPEFDSVPKLQELRVKILDDTIQYYEQFKADTGSSPETDYQAAKLYLKIGEFTQGIKPETEAVIKAYADGIDLAKNVVLQEPKRNEYRELLAELHAAAADYWWLPVQIATKKTSLKAANHFEQAEQQYAQLDLANPGHPEYRRQRGWVFARMAYLYRRDFSTDPRMKKYAQRSIDLGYGDHAILARVVANEDPNLAEKYWRKFLKEEKSGSIRFDDTAWSRTLAARFFTDRDPQLSYKLYRKQIIYYETQWRDFPANRSFWNICSAHSSELLRLLRKMTDTKSELLREADALVQANPAFHRLRARVSIDLKDSDQKLKFLTSSIESYPQHAQHYYYHRARHLIHIGKNEAALEDTSRCLQLNENYTYIYGDRGKLRHQLGQYQGAVEDITKRITGTGGAEVEFFGLRAASHFELGQYVKALADLQHALKLRPKSVGIPMTIAPSRVATCPDDAFRAGVVRLANDAVEVNRGSTESLVARATVMVGFGRNEKALEDLNSAMARDDGDYYSHYQAALLAAKTSHKDLYRSVCQKISSASYADVENENVNEAYFACWSCVLAPNAIDDFESVIKLARHAVEEDPDNPQFISGFGAVLMRAERYDEAKEQLQQALEVNESGKSSASYIHYFLAMTHQHLGDLDAAQEQLANANESAAQELAGSPSWNRKLTLELLREEATILIQ